VTRAPKYRSGWSLTVQTKGGRKYRLFRRAGVRWQCRVCGYAVRREAAERHLAVEVNRAGGEDTLAEHLVIIALRGRSARWRQRSQYYHEKARKEGGIELTK